MISKKKNNNFEDKPSDYFTEKKNQAYSGCKSI